MNATFFFLMLAPLAQAGPATELRIHTVNLRGDPVDNIDVRAAGVVGKSSNGIAAFRINRIEPIGHMQLVINLASAAATRPINSGYVGRVRDVHWNSLEELANGFVVPIWTENDLNTFASAFVYKPRQFAIAIRYERRSLARPMVVARYAGSDAEEWATRVAPDVPAISMPEFTQSLFGNVYVGQDIPAAFDPDLQKLYAELDDARNSTQRSLRPTDQDSGQPAVSTPTGSAVTPRPQSLDQPLAPLPQSQSAVSAGTNPADSRPTLNPLPTNPYAPFPNALSPSQTTAVPALPYQYSPPLSQTPGQTYPVPNVDLSAPCKVVVHNTGSCDFNLQVNANIILVRRGAPTVVSVPFTTVTTIVPQEANRVQKWNHWRYAGGEYLMELKAQTWTRYRLKREQTVNRLYYALPPSNSPFDLNRSQAPLRWVPQCEVELTAVAPAPAPQSPPNDQLPSVVYPQPAVSTVP